MSTSEALSKAKEFLRVVDEFCRKFGGNWRSIDISIHIEPTKESRESHFEKFNDLNQAIKFLEEHIPKKGRVYGVHIYIHANCFRSSREPIPIPIGKVYRELSEKIRDYVSTSSRVDIVTYINGVRIDFANNIELSCTLDYNKHGFGKHLRVSESKSCSLNLF